MACTNLSVVTVILTIILLGSSVPIQANPYYKNPSDSYQQSPVEAPSEDSNIKCQDFGQVCPGGGKGYSCCDKLVCRTLAVGGSFICLPPLVPGKNAKYRGCKAKTELCLGYGEYKCCGNLSCVPVSPTGLVGVGVCLPMGRTNSSTTTGMCQKLHQLCQRYGEYKCCSGFNCLDPRGLRTPPVLPVDPKLLPPGFGACIAFKV